MKVNEIFTSIEGEGKRAGALATFIRLAGCNLRCSYCDTRYALSISCGEKMALDEILKKVREISIGKYVTLTGGEPFYQGDDVNTLIQLLIEDGYEVNVETNGSYVPTLCSRPGSLFYTMDYKGPSSNEETAMQDKAFDMLTTNDVLKFVVGSREDLDAARHFLMHRLRTYPQIYFSPIFGSIEAKEIVDYLKEYKLSVCKVQLQLHKYIWDPNERGV